MEWLNPTYLWALAAVPAVIGLFLWAAWRRRVALERFGDLSIVSRLTGSVSARRRRWKAAATVAGVLFIAVALAGPRLGTEVRDVRREGIDLVIALDVSASMTAEDVAPNRLDRAKNEIRKLLSELHGDRVGLVIFAGDAFIQCPLTTDYSALRLFLDVANPSLIPTPGTDFGAALRMAIQAFDAPTDGENQAPTRALLFVSDGENHVADIDEIVRSARNEGIVMFGAGVGETAGAPIPEYQNGRRVGYKRDSGGNIVNTRLEEDALQELASEGAYFRIARTSSSLQKITSSLDRLEKQEFAQSEFESFEERYQWPLAVALLFLVIERLVTDRRKTRATTTAA